MSFPHRRNKNFSYDSFCPKCFERIGSEQDEDALAACEAVHVCDPLRLHRLGKASITRFLLTYTRRNPENEH